MLKTTLAAILVSTSLAGAALAQTTAPAGQFMTEQGATEFRASKFVGLDVYGSDNEKIGDIKEILISPDGGAKGVILGVGGFLGIGEKNVAVAWTALAWSNDKPATRSAAGTAPATTGSTGGTTAAPMTAGVPATATTATAARSPAEQAAYNGYPDHATVQLTKADLQNAPAFKYYSETHSSSGATGNATPPAARQ